MLHNNLYWLYCLLFLVISGILNSYSIIRWVTFIFILKNGEEHSVTEAKATLFHVSFFRFIEGGSNGERPGHWYFLKSSQAILTGNHFNGLSVNSWVS